MNTTSWLHLSALLNFFIGITFLLGSNNIGYNQPMSSIDGVIHFSVNPRPVDPSRPYLYAEAWAAVSTDIQGLEIAVTERVWSPCVWKNGYRRASDFASAEVVAFDFDDTWRLDDAKAYVTRNDLKHIIGITKSHQVAKNNAPACDRFRLILFASTTVTDLWQYQQNMKHFMKAFPCDESCKDGARYFFPCKEIVSKGEGKRLRWNTFQKPDPRLQAIRRALEEKNYHASGRLPPWVEKSLLYGKEHGSRHRYVYAVAAELATLGWREEDIVSRVMASNLADIGEKDVRHQVRYGYRRTRGT